MADTYIIHEGQTGAVSQYAVPFEYLSTTHVKVEVNDVPVAFNFLSTYLIDISPNPVGKVRIYRDTPDEAITTFTDGSVLLDDDLNSAFVQSIYISQEAKDTATDEMASAIATVEGLLEETETARDVVLGKIDDAEEILDQVQTLRDQSVGAAEAATSMVGFAFNHMTDAETAAGAASDSAASAAQSLTEAQALVEQLEETLENGAVVSINGRSGIVTGLAEADDVYTKAESDTALDLKADKATTYTKEEIDAALVQVAGSTGITSLLKYSGWNEW